jgi:putative ABC transport system permease protein
MRSLLVVAEVAAATLLLCGAGLLLRTLLNVEQTDRGYRTNGILTMMVDPLGSEYPTRESLVQFLQGVEHEVRSLPGVSHVAWASTLPMGASTVGDVSFEILGDAPLDANRRPLADYQVVSPGYFGALDIPVVAGRGFDDRDRGDATRVAIVNEAVVRSHFQGRSPIGHRLAIRPPGAADTEPTIREIVGVAAQVKARPDELEHMRQIYVPMEQNLLGDIYLAVRPASPDRPVSAAAVRAAIGRIDRNQLVSVREVATLDEIARSATSRHRFRAVMVVTFAALALVLAMIGVFGILAYSVQQRVRELGVRMALGASVGDVLRLVLASAARLIAAGSAIGLVLAALLGRLLTTVLFGVDPLDPLTFGLAVLVVAGTGALAIAAPAWRASRIDPAIALRAE